MQLPSSRCRECPLYSRLRYHVPATRVPGAKIAVVGEAPGEREVRQKRGYVGPAGRLLTSMMQAAGLNRAACTISNVLKCQPQNNKLPADTWTAIECCSEILEEDLQGVEIVIGTGNIPLRALVSLDKITKRRGSVYEMENGRPFIATMHPAALLRNMYVKNGRGTPQEVVTADLARAKRILDGEEWKVEENYIVEPTKFDLDSFLEELYRPREMVALDIETTWDRVLQAVPLTVAFSLPEITLCVEFEEELEWIKEALESPTPKIFHNGVFDASVLENVGYEVKEWNWDTLYMHHLLYAELPHSLGFVQSLHSWMPFHKDMKNDLAEAFDK